MTEHFAVLGLARARARWFRDVSRWASSAALPVELVKCVSIEEVRACLEGGRAWSALLIDAGLPSLDRDLVDRARQVGCAVVAVDDGARQRDWAALAVAGVLAEPLERSALLAVLRDHGRPVRDGDLDFDLDLGPAPALGGPAPAPLVAVTGPPGSGAPTVAMALAQGMAVSRSGGGDGADSGDGHAGGILLADLALDGDQALRHGTGDVVPGLLELVEAHRGASPPPEAARNLTFRLDDRGYHLLAGLRRHRDWAALRPRATEAAIESLRRAFAVVVADVTPDVEGEDDCGSLDVEERNHLARYALLHADVAVLACSPTALGVHALVRLLDDLGRNGVDPARVLPVVLGAPRPGPARSELARALGQLAVLPGSGGAARSVVQPVSPLFITQRRDLDELVTAARPLPKGLCEPVATAVARLLDRLGPLSRPEPVAIRPGSLGSWKGGLSDL